MIQELNSDTFNSTVVNGKGLVLVDFWAPWCGPCRMMAPILEETSKKVTNVTFAKINTDDYQEIAANYRITGIPCLILFKDGKEATRFVGVQPANVLESNLKKY